MKNFLILAAAVAVSAVAAFGTPCSTTSPTNNLIAGPTNGISNPPSPVDTNAPCTVGTLTFQNFSYNIDTGTFIGGTPDVALESASAGPPVTIAFNPNLTANSDLQLEFQVTGGVIGVQLQATITGTGFVDETVCTVFSTSNNCPQQDILAILTETSSGATEQLGSNSATLVNVTGSGALAQETFAGQSQVWIFKDINSGDVPYSEVTQGFVTPEPATLSLLGAGLLGLGLVRRRAKK